MMSFVRFMVHPVYYLVNDYRRKCINEYVVTNHEVGSSNLSRQPTYLFDVSEVVGVRHCFSDYRKNPANGVVETMAETQTLRTDRSWTNSHPSTTHLIA
jgi:hypothetical protein